VSEKTRINWHQGLRLGDSTRRYRRFRDGHMSPSELETKVNELEDQEDQRDYDDYWNPWDPAGEDYYDHIGLGYLMNELRNVAFQKAGGRLDVRSALGQTVDIVLPFTEALPKTPAAQAYLPTELSRILSAHIRMTNRGYPISADGTSSADVRFALEVVAGGDLDIMMKLIASREFRNNWHRNAFEGLAGSLLMALLFAPFWVRPLSGWTDNPSTGGEIILSLVDYLFVTYPVPEFLYGNWLTERNLPTTKWMCWFVLLGQGANLHQATEHFTEWVIPKSFVRYLYQAPPDLTPLEACIWAEVHRLGGSAVEFQRLRWHPNYLWDPTSKHERDLRFQSFWRDTVRWLTRHREELTDQMCDLILEWASHMFGMDQRGQFTLRHRSPRNTYEAAERFAETTKNPLYMTWRNHGWDWEYVGQNEDVWLIRELTTGYQLQEEGCAMHHCVQGYTSRCWGGLDSIFSLTVNGERRLTIQVNPTRKSIVEARGFSDRSATHEENLLLGVWQKEVLNS